MVQNMRRSERGLQQHLPIFSVNQNKYRYALKNESSTDVKVAITLLAMKASNKII